MSKQHTAFIRTIDFGMVPIRKTHANGTFYKDIELSDEGYAEVRIDVRTHQPFAVLLDEDYNPLFPE